MTTQSNKKGFTLIELLVVIAVIGILASVILVGLSGARARGRDAKRIQDLRQIQNGLELYFSANGSYPASGALYTALPQANLGISNLPLDPQNGNQYGYCLSGNRYVVGANLEQSNAEAYRSTVSSYPCAPSGVGTCTLSGGTAPTGAWTYCVTI
jgi:prepilin-type N-terminal cleavage/methylation domain-containing protein